LLTFNLKFDKKGVEDLFLTRFAIEDFRDC